MAGWLAGKKMVFSPPHIFYRTNRTAMWSITSAHAHPVSHSKHTHTSENILEKMRNSTFHLIPAPLQAHPQPRGPLQGDPAAERICPMPRPLQPHAWSHGSQDSPNAPLGPGPQQPHARAYESDWVTSTAGPGRLQPHVEPYGKERSEAPPSSSAQLMSGSQQSHARAYGPGRDTSLTHDTSGPLHRMQLPPRQPLASLVHVGCAAAAAASTAAATSAAAAGHLPVPPPQQQLTHPRQQLPVPPQQGSTWMALAPVPQTAGYPFGMLLAPRPPPTAAHAVAVDATMRHHPLPPSGVTTIGRPRAGGGGQALHAGAWHVHQQAPPAPPRTRPTGIMQGPLQSETPSDGQAPTAGAWQLHPQAPPALPHARPTGDVQDPLHAESPSAHVHLRAAPPCGVPPPRQLTLPPCHARLAPDLPAFNLPTLDLPAHGFPVLQRLHSAVDFHGEGDSRVEAGDGEAAFIAPCCGMGEGGKKTMEGDGDETEGGGVKVVITDGDHWNGTVGCGGRKTEEGGRKMGEGGAAVVITDGEHWNGMVGHRSMKLAAGGGKMREGGAAVVIPLGAASPQDLAKATGGTARRGRAGAASTGSVCSGAVASGTRRGGGRGRRESSATRSSSRTSCSGGGSSSMHSTVVHCHVLHSKGQKVGQIVISLV